MEELDSAVVPYGSPEAERLYMLTEECNVTRCKVDASSPEEAAIAAGDAEWCPGGCAAFVAEMERCRPAGVA